MFWCLGGGSCLNHGFSRIIRIARIEEVVLLLAFTLKSA